MIGYKLCLIVPCYNEEEIITDSAKCLENEVRRLMKNGSIAEESRILFVDDGSSDKTWSVIKKLYDRDSLFMGIRLSHNQGKECAMMAGMMHAKNHFDCVITLDADMQDDIGVMEQFLIKYSEGCHVVYGVRKARDRDTRFKRNTAKFFYKIMGLLGTEIIYNHADYRLLSNKALRALEQYKEVNLFLRGIVPLIGLKSDIVYHDRLERKAGYSKYPLKKLISFAFEGITSFSIKPLRVISCMGIFFSLISIIGLGYALGSYFFGFTVRGWTAIVCSIWLLGGIQLLCIGMVGEYIGKIYGEVKQRPRYFIDEILE